MKAEQPFVGRTPALENVDLQLPVDIQRSNQAQRRGRRLVPGGNGPAQEDRTFAGLGADLQAADLLRPGLRACRFRSSARRKLLRE